MHRYTLYMCRVGELLSLTFRNEIDIVACRFNSAKFHEIYLCISDARLFVCGKRAHFEPNQSK